MTYNADDYLSIHKKEIDRLWSLEDAAVHFLTTYIDLAALKSDKSAMVTFVCETDEHQAAMVGALYELRQAVERRSIHRPNGELLKYS